jgi:SPP1 gp7 family putative phage head morphogenesis protein
MNILQQRAWHWAQLTENEIFLEVQDVLGQAVREGLTVQQIIDALKESSVFSDARAERIARTEVIGSLNEGKLAGYRDTGLVRMKEWLATQDDRTRDAHLDADGEIVPIDEPFTKTGEALMFPGDPSGSPGNIINCRCTVLPVVETEGEVSE